MSTKFILHTIFLVLAVALTYFWTLNPLAQTYTLHLTAVLILIYFTIHFALRKGKKPHKKPIVTLDLTILTATILIIVTQTGGLSSPFFFTIYFLLFAVAMLFETEATLVLTGTLLIFLSLLPNTELSNALHISHLVSMLMITPLAIFTAHQHEEKILQEQKNEIIEAQLTQEETDTLLFITLNLKRTLISALDKLSIIIPQSKFKKAKNDLTLLYQDLKNLYRSADTLQEYIDKETEE